MDSKPILNDKTYNVLKRLVQVVIPAISSLYFGLSQIWGFPATEQIVGTLALLATVLGGVVGYSSKRYMESDARFDGDAIVSTTDDGVTLYSLELNVPIDELKEKDELAFKVVPS